jgi:hypothetical protein
MTSEQELYSMIAKAPGVPSEVFGSIESALRKRAANRIRLWAVAAAVVVAAGALPIVNYSISSGRQVQPEVESELLTVRDFLNSGDLETEFDQYALVEGY